MIAAKKQRIRAYDYILIPVKYPHRVYNHLKLQKRGV